MMQANALFCGTSALCVHSSCKHSAVPCATRPYRLSCLLSGPGPRFPLQQFTTFQLQSCVHRQCRKRSAAARAAADTPQYVEDTTFRIERVSFGKVLTPLGVGLLSYGFLSYFQLLPGTSAGAIVLIYGFPLTLLGFALSYAQLEPVPCRTTQQAIDLRANQMTDIQKQVREDVTRYRYGDEQHLEEALARIFQFNRPNGIPRRLSPRLTAVREDVIDGAYALTLEFATRKEMGFDLWQSRLDKIQSFFGPGITASLNQRDNGVDVTLKSDGSGAGRGGPEQKDLLPPLVPGLRPRQQK